MSRFDWIVLLGVTWLLAGCSNDKKEELKEYVSQVKSQSIGQVEPLPEVKPYETFTYNAQELRSPFEPPKPEDNVVAQKTSDSGITPDIHRRKEALEAYPLDTLEMVGTLEKKGHIWAVIIDKDGNVHRITKGNYVGQNHGKITKVTEEKIKMTEIIPDGSGGWIEREASMTLVE